MEFLVFSFFTLDPACGKSFQRDLVSSAALVTFAVYLIDPRFLRAALHLFAHAIRVHVT